MEITKREAKKALDLETDAQLARVFKGQRGRDHVTRWAVGQWPEDEPLPEGRQWELRAKYPDKFPTAASKEAA